MDAHQGMAGFLPAYYLQHYPDVARAVNNSEVDAARHYVQFGINELRSPNPFFEPSVYKTYPDLTNFTGEQLLEHWINFGIKELRRGSEHFDLGFYFNNFPDIHQIIGGSVDGLFQHWIQFGNAEGRLTADGNRILRIGHRPAGPATDLVAASSGSESNDPDLFKPFNTTGGQIGFGVGLVVGTVVGGIAFGDPIDGAFVGAEVGTLIGHGLDRIITHVANDITGPAWHDLEQSPIVSKLTGVIVSGSGGIGIPLPQQIFPLPPLPPINFPPIRF